MDKQIMDEYGRRRGRDSNKLRRKERTIKE